MSSFALEGQYTELSAAKICFYISAAENEGLFTRESMQSSAGIHLALLLLGHVCSSLTQ
jgi:hypothetical protein